ncbi:MurR/RpiR family transcriptional regulator [Tabrizicola sp.]|jgi:DNA-binding MurR/RpiR family transcriptional regulator|uniref:MurR/RpiR family transcriptional regulator n=1 Tax=Tabrizicola sp. TaxID=2005166 RepID=UPI001A5E2AA7|nr:MurR/RpiR family transcriptional regulator [Tabrizicola sp.]MBL9062877.1 MurR/RpiR family transcriptional regulator [Tabrizicola sp.]
MPKGEPSTEPREAPQSVEAFRDRLLALNGQLPRRLQQCADHVATHLDRIALSTVAQVAHGAGVPPSAVMRFCQIMGFTGFAEMQRLFRDALSRSAPDYATRLANLKAGGVGQPSTLVAEFVEAGRQSMEALARDLNEDTLNQAVATLARARTIHLAGFRRSFPVASYLAYVFDKLGVAAVLHDGVAGLGHRSSLRPGDALLAITFAPYSEETLALASHARDSGLPVVVLTDPPASQLAGIADTILTVTEIDFGAFRSLSAVIALALSLAVAVAARRET